MRRFALIVVLCLFATPALADARLIQAIREAATDERALELVEQVEEGLADAGALRFSELVETGRALQTRRLFAAEARLLARWAGKLDDSRSEFFLAYKVTEAWLRAEELDRATEWGRKALALAADDPHPAGNDAYEGHLHGLLARVHEAAGRHEEALQSYEEWTLMSRCGDGLEQYEAERDLGIARMRFRLGQREDALRAMARVALRRVDRGLALPTAEGVRELGLHACEVGDVDTWRKSAEELPAALRTAWTRIFDAGVAFAEDDLARVLSLIDEGRAGATPREAEAHLRTIVPYALGPAVQRHSEAASDATAAAIGTAIREGNRTVTLLGVEYGLPGVAKALRGRLQAEDDPEWRRTIEAGLER